MAGRPRKPTAHLELVGAFEKNPQRQRDAEPVCYEGPGAAPSRLTAGQAEVWDYLVDCAVPGVLTKMDRAYLELCAIALASIWYPRGEPASLVPLPERLTAWMQKHDHSAHKASQLIGVSVSVIKRIQAGRQGKPGIDRKVEQYLELAMPAVQPSDPAEISIKDVGVMLGKLGMTPSDRSRVVVPKAEPKKRKYGKL